MKVEYRFNTFDERRMLTAISNLLMYYNDVSMNVREKLTMLKKEKRARDILVQYIRKGTGNLSITIDTVFSAVETAVEQGDIFWFEVDGKRFCDMLHNKKELSLVFHMDDNYFLTEMAYSKYLPSKNWLTKKYSDDLGGEKLKWMDWIDGQWKHDRKIMNTDYVRNIMED